MASIPKDRDPEMNSAEWPFSLPRSVVHHRYTTSPDGNDGSRTYRPGDIAFAQKDGEVYPVIFGYKEKGYLIKKNRWMISDKEMSERKLSHPSRVEQIINFRDSDWESNDFDIRRHDPVASYLDECQKRGRLPDKVMMELLGKMWSTYLKRRGIRESGEEG